jgi:hypothetical protein
VTAAMILQTEFAFTLPYGYVDERGDRHQQGVMRLATALDEIEPLRDPRVQENQAYVSVLVLSRVITRLDGVITVTPAVIERLFSADFNFLQDLYIRVNDAGTSLVETACPACGTHFTLDVSGAAPEA